MKDKLIEESLEDVDVSFEMERKSEKGIAKNIISDEDDESDESDESYVPDSLRDFLKAADKQLEADLSFLSPAAPTTLYNKDAVMTGQDDDEDEGTNILASDLEKEMAKARQKDLERENAMKQEALDRQEREQKQVDQNELEKQQKQQRIEESARAQAQQTLMDDDEDDMDMDMDDDNDANVTSPLLDIVHPSADVTESHVKRIAMEGADIVEPEPLQPLVEGTTTHLPSPTINSDMAALANGATSFSPTPPRKVGRKLEMQLDAEAHRASLSPGQLRLEGQEDDDDDDDDNNNQNNISMESIKSTLEEKQKSMREKQERLKELQSRSVERKKRLEVLDDKEAERNSVEVVLKDTPVVQQPTPAAAAAATKAAEVPRKNLTGPVKALPPHMRPRNAQKWSFKPRDAPSPPRPKEIITHSLFSPDGRPVSPLGNEQPVVSPLASPNTKQTSYRRAPVRRYQPTQPSPSKRRPLTKPTNHTFSFMKPTAASNALVGKAEETRKKVNPEEERRKARERIRQRMAAQRRNTAKSTSLASPPVNTAAAQRAKERKERVQKMEEERKAKIKAKIAEKEERLKKFEEAKKKEEAARKRQKKATPQSSKPPSVTRPSSRPLTIPVGPKFSIDRRLAQKEAASVKKSTVSLAASSQNFAKGLRSSAPPPRNSTPEPRRLTIPMAPKFSIAGTPINSPPRKGRDIADDVSWSSSLRDVSAIISPVSKAANSIRTGNNLTIPITPQFHPIRKRPLPKSTAEREKEEMEHAKEHAFKARMERNKQLLAVARAKPKNPPPKRTLTQPTPFRFSTLNRRGVLDYEEVGPSLVQTKPKPNVSSKNSVASSKKPVKKTPSQPRRLTTPEPFTFRSASRNRSTYTKSETESTDSYTFKPKPMPDFKKAHRKSYGKRIPSPRALTTPEPFHFRSENSSRRSTPKSEQGTSSYKPFKPRPMPDFKTAHQNSVQTKKLKSPPTRPLTIPIPFKFRETTTRRRVETKEEKETYKPFKPRPMPNFEKVSPQTQREIDRAKAKKSRSKKPTGASGLLFRHRLRQEPPKYKVGHMPNFIPEVIVTRTPIKDSRDEKPPKYDNDNKSIELGKDMDDELEEDNIFSDFDRFHDSRRKIDKIGSSTNLRHTPSPHKKENDKNDDDNKSIELGKDAKYELDEDNILSDFDKFHDSRFKIDNTGNTSNLRSSSNLRHTPSPRKTSPSPRKKENKSSNVFKPRPSPKNMLDEPKIPVRMRDSKKLRHTPSPRKAKEGTEERFVFKPRPAPKGMLDDPKIPVRKRDPKKLRSPDSVKRPTSPDEPTPIRRTNALSPIRKLESPDRFYDASPIRKPSSPDRFYDASPYRNQMGSPVASPPRIHRDAASNNSSITTRNSHSTGTGNVMEDAKARLRERLSQRQSNSAAVKAATPNRDKSKPKSQEPMAFSTLRVKSLLDSNSNARKEEQLRKESSFENTPRKSNREVPKSIDLPSGEKAHQTKTFPNIPNYTTYEGSPAESSGFHTANDGSDAKEAALLKETKLALALGIPDGDESSSILQLARDVQKAAEDELSFYGSVDTRDHWSSSLADGKPHSLLG